MAASDDHEHLRRLYAGIYRVIRRIPAGSVATYGQVAELAGIPNGGRVAGAALKVSAPTDQLPWQRVVGKAGPRRARIAIHDPVGAAIQRQLLEAEGVEITDVGLISLEQFGWRWGATGGSSLGASPRRPPRSGSKRRASSSRR
jgi:methylated-DNA-protein-cysteine methyltransferase related protein